MGLSIIHSARLAQSVERWTLNPTVVGSSPTLGELLARIYRFTKTLQWLNVVNIHGKNLGRKVDFSENYAVYVRPGNIFSLQVVVSDCIAHAFKVLVYSILSEICLGIAVGTACFD